MIEFCYLPDEIQTEIFSHLDGDTLKQASFVCSRWNELIGSSSQLMSNFKLSLINIAYKRWASSEKQVLQLRRKYQHLRAVLNGYEDVASVSRVLKRHGSHLRSFDALAATFDTPESCHRVLSAIPLLQTLVITNCKVLTINNARFPLVDLRSLKSLELVCSSWRFLEFLEGCPVELLTVEGGYKGHLPSLINFLSIVRQLKSLRVNSIPFKAVFRSEKSRDFRFNLRRLRVAYNKVADTQLDENFNAFLSTQKELRVLDLMYPASKIVLRTVFNSLPNLTSLILSVNNLPAQWEFYENLQPLKLKKLEIIGQFPNEDAATGILLLCPNIEDFSAETDLVVPSLLPFMASNNRSIRKLSIATINQASSNVIKLSSTKLSFKHLKHFEVDRLVNQACWLSFVEGQTSIETLKIRKYSWHTLSEELTTSLDHLPNVKSILFVDFYDNLQTQ